MDHFSGGSLAFISWPLPSFATDSQQPHTFTAACALWEFNLTYCYNIFSCWFGYWEAKKINNKTFFLPFSQAQLHSRHISSPLVISTGYTQFLWWGNEWHRGLGSRHRGFSLLLLVSHPVLPLLLPSYEFPLLHYGHSLGHNLFGFVATQLWSTSKSSDLAAPSFPCLSHCHIPSLSLLVAS